MLPGTRIVSTFGGGNMRQVAANQNLVILRKINTTSNYKAKLKQELLLYDICPYRKHAQQLQVVSLLNKI